MLKIDNKKKFNLLVALGAALLAFGLRIILFLFIETSGLWESLIFSLIVFWIFPVFIIKSIFNEKISDFNFRFQIIGRNVVWSILSLVFLVGVSVFCVIKFDWDKFLVVSNWIVGGKGILLFVDFVLLPIIILFQEFFFRGFLFESISRYWSSIVSIFVVSFLYTAFFYLIDNELVGLRFAFLFFINLLLTVIMKLNRSVILSAVLMWIYVVAIDLLVLQRMLEIQQ